MEIDINGVIITLTKEQLEQVTKRLAKPTEKIDLAGGEWYIGVNGNVFEGRTAVNVRGFGLEAATKEVATKMARDMKLANRIRARAYEIDPDFVDTFDYTKQSKVILSYIYNSSGKYKHSNCCSVREAGTVYMSKDTAIQLCQEINDGLFDPFN